MGFFKKEDIRDEKLNVVNEVKIVEKEVQDSSKVKRKNLALFDVDTMAYVIKNFPSMSEDIKEGLMSLSDILEKTIDHIEDKSSELVKENRNFELSQSYRDTSIAIYKMVNNIKDYVFWMNDECEKNNMEQEEKKNEKIEEEELTKCNIENEHDTPVSHEISIFSDFTGKEPKAFIIREDIVKVDDWNDLLVKTAEVLTKKYKNNKNSNKVVASFEVVDIKSIQNEFRDTAIEMLNEYKISLDQFKIIVK
ncbi:MAG: hypothetical protein E7207_03895 [Clostridium butyricum]|nr:hypothetical protein [Clostridium butyricum]